MTERIFLEAIPDTPVGPVAIASSETGLLAVEIVIPCHRLVGSDGSLRGYGAPGGIETKAWLLAFEAEQARKAG